MRDGDPSDPGPPVGDLLQARRKAAALLACVRELRRETEALTIDLAQLHLLARRASLAGDAAAQQTAVQVAFTHDLLVNLRRIVALQHTLLSDLTRGGHPR